MLYIYVHSFEVFNCPIKLTLVTQETVSITEAKMLMLFRDRTVFYFENKKRHKCTMNKIHGFDIKASYHS
jgi:hypothetical protein